MSKRPNRQVLVPDARVRPPDESAPPVRFEDAVLVERVRGGDMDAFGMLVSKYQDKIYNTCWRMCGHVEDARDLTQEAFFRAFQAIASFKGHSGFYTWIFRIAVNLTLSHRRKAKHRRAQSLDGDGPSNDQAGPLRDRLADESAPQPIGQAMASELQRQVERTLEALDPDHRAVIVLRDMEGFDYAEIARILDVAVGTVKSRLHRARVSLRERLRPYVDEEG